MSGFDPTPEQLVALDLFKTGQSLAIEAGAGAGKTSTLKLMAESTSRRGQYVAFNKAIVDESKSKFPATVRCNTAHSLAFGAVGKKYTGRLDSSRRMPSWELARILRIDPIWVTTYADEKKQLTPAFLAGLAMRSVTRFCQTADDRITHRHVPYVQGLDAPSHMSHGPKSYAVNNEVARSLEPALIRAWKDLVMFEGALPFKHEHYLKIWQLQDPRIWADYILFDEAQDASPVLIDAVLRQEHAQVVWVGDSQQAIYEFTGAVNALQNVGAENTAYLTQSFRFGQAIADVANGPLAALNAPLRVKGFAPIRSRVEEIDSPVCVLTRTNATAVRTVLEAKTAGRQPHLVGGGGEVLSFARAAGRLMTGERVDHPELAMFESWGEVQTYVEEDEQGGDLKLMVKLIDEFTVERIIEALENTTPEYKADVVVSTAHKSKGREWDTVQLADDFADEPEEAELRLLYVAVTRAKLALDVSRVIYFNPQRGLQ
jgi:UvrD-like helicase C-terminal domain/AAA domain